MVVGGIVVGGGKGEERCGGSRWDCGGWRIGREMNSFMLNGQRQKIVFIREAKLLSF